MSIDCSVLDYTYIYIVSPVLMAVLLHSLQLLSFIFSKDAIVLAVPAFGRWSDRSPIFDSLVELAQPLVLVAIMNLLPPILNFLATVR